MEKWLEDLNSMIFNNIKINFSEKIKNDLKISDTAFTTNQVTLSKSLKFPTIQVSVVSTTEEGDDLEGDTINAVSTTIQVDVLTNTQQSDATRIANEITKILKKKMNFHIRPLPKANQSIVGGSTIYRSMIQANRRVGGNDVNI